MNLLVGDALDLAAEVQRLSSDAPDVEIVVCPPYTSLYPVGQALLGSAIALGAQDCFPEERGAYTGADSRAPGRFERRARGTGGLPEPQRHGNCHNGSVPGSAPPWNALDTWRRAQWELGHGI